MTALIFDTETTGGNEPALIEAGGLIFTSEEKVDLRPAVRFCQRYNPGVPSTLGALAVHHILDEELADCPPASSFALPDGLNYIIGHNIDYDCKVIGEPRIRRICTLALSRSFYPELESHTLGAMAYHFMGAEARPLLKDAHNAASDCETTRHVLRHLLPGVVARGFLLTWEGLYACSELSRVPTVMSFGKHKGAPVSELPRDYVDWLLKQPDMDRYLRQALGAY